VIYSVLGAGLIALTYLVLMIVGRGLPLLLAPIIGGVAFFFWHVIDPEERGRTGQLRLLLTSGLGTAIGFLSGWLLELSQNPLVDAAGIPIAVAVAAAAFTFKAHQRTVTCVLCRNAATGHAGFDCPRCGDRVCTRPSCWHAKYARCTRCHDREIVIFPIQEKWWASRLGPKVTTGECLSCYKDAQETDLRECHQCHWPMCRRCWDHYNGTCQRCEWVIPGLPQRLVPFMRKTKSARESTAPDRQSRRPPPRPPRPPESDGTVKMRRPPADSTQPPARRRT